MGVKKLLHVGCGPKNTPVPREFQAYREVRLDVNRDVHPDIQANVIAMPMVEDASFDAVYASHILEHLAFHEVVVALKEIFRVLKPGGQLKLHVPDLQAIGGLLGCDKADQILYQSGSGPVTALDMLYGHRGMVAKGNGWMAHKCGFTASVLQSLFHATGFVNCETNRETKYELIAYAHKGEEHAGQEPSPESISEREIWAPMGQGPPLRQQRQTAGACEQNG